MARPLGKNQRSKIMMLASFGRFQVVPDAETRSLAKRGLVREWGDDAFVGITAAGFRLIADEMDAGRMENTPDLKPKERKDGEGEKS